MIAIMTAALITGSTHQLSLIGIRLRDTPAEQGDSQIAVVVSNRTVIKHYQSQAQQIKQIKAQFGGGSSCGCTR